MLHRKIIQLNASQEKRLSAAITYMNAIAFSEKGDDYNLHFDVNTQKGRIFRCYREDHGDHGDKSNGASFVIELDALLEIIDTLRTKGIASVNLSCVMTSWAYNHDPYNRDDDYNRWQHNLVGTVQGTLSLVDGKLAKPELRFIAAGS
jgi:hypothetical protein